MPEPSPGVLATYIAGLSGSAREAGLIFAVFLVGGVIYHLVLNRTGLRGAITYLFPRDLYRHTSARSDRWNFFLTYLIWFLAMRVVLTVALAVASLQVVHGFLVESFGAQTALITTPLAVIVFQFLCLLLTSEFGAYPPTSRCIACRSCGASTGSIIPPNR